MSVQFRVLPLLPGSTAEVAEKYAAAHGDDMRLSRSVRQRVYGALRLLERKGRVGSRWQWNEAKRRHERYWFDADRSVAVRDPGSTVTDRARHAAASSPWRRGFSSPLSKRGDDRE